MLAWGLAALFTLVLPGALAPAEAEDYPSRSVTIVSPYAPGGMSSLLGRAIGARLEQRLGKPFVIEKARRRHDPRRAFGRPCSARRLPPP